MLAECINRPFKDNQAGVFRQPGDRFECTAERMAEINSAGYGEMVISVEQPKEEPKARKRKAAKEQ